MMSDGHKKVVLRMEIDLIVEVPDDWDTDQIHYFYNDGTHCTSNEIQQLADTYMVDDDHHCPCPASKFTYLRDVDEKDEMHVIRRDDYPNGYPAMLRGKDGGIYANGSITTWDVETAKERNK